MIVAITGASSGIGYEVARALQTEDNCLVLIGRDESRYQGLCRPKDVFFTCELSSLASVALTSKAVRDEFATIDLLINNAAAAGQRGVTVDGFELAFGVNYLSHYLLTRSLGRVERVVNVSSEAHRGVKNLDPERGLGRTRSRLAWREYQFSKAAQIAFTQSLVRRNVAAYAAHPGVIATELWRRVPGFLRGFVTSRMQPPSAGAIPILRAATDASLAPGSYMTPGGVVAPNPIVTDAGVAERLWQRSEQWVTVYLP